MSDPISRITAAGQAHRETYIAVDQGDLLVALDAVPSIQDREILRSSALVAADTPTRTVRLHRTKHHGPLLAALAAVTAPAS